MAKHSQEFKLSVVEYYLSGRGGQKRTAQYFAIPHSTVRKWVCIYEEHGKAGLARQTSKTIYSVEFKHQVVLTILNEGLSSREAAQHFKIKEPGMLIRWLRQFQAEGIEGLQPKPKGRPKRITMPQLPKSESTKADRAKSYAELLEELNYLRAENAFLKKLRALRLEQAAQEQAEQQKLQGLSQD